MKKKATIADVAKLANVSTFTASRALQNKPNVAAATQQRVIEAAKSLNYTASKAAAALASGKTDRIALLLGDQLTGWSNGNLQDGVYDVLSPKGYDLLVYRAGNDDERKKYFANLPANRNADGLIASFTLNSEESNALTTMGMPIISVNSDSDTCCQGSVKIDDRQALKDVVGYLAGLGHKRFCFIDQENLLPDYEWSSDKRILGYQDAIAERHLTDCGIFVMPKNGERPARQIIARLLSMENPPTAICTLSDDCALATCTELIHNGISIPQQVSVIGFDSSNVSELTGISSVSQPLRKIGQIAAQKLLTLLNGQDLSEPHTLIPAPIVPRNTTGRAPLA
ncbi:LacI family DNA-binding transcriptional regulator [Bifidobacterium sp. ESL0764]|uniref:LacI family DNA-binding transcriptional regulator n=1 Tax=Bifidobacterium sp. ESL0764 TaxID=2983228 RepID=UPI0023F6247D|nr:LacI family DNA-binding transcriptional regulator [Bifidobacterium sp. ESL0764]WEV65714.1 LacI family DNA-binding transcriptional regulator [Bifidobacterium sp. ESL0764]